MNCLLRRSELGSGDGSAIPVTGRIMRSEPAAAQAGSHAAVRGAHNTPGGRLAVLQTRDQAASVHPAPMSTNDLLAGLGLVIVLAIACQLVAARTRLPAIVLLLPVGFIAGAATDDVHPDVLFGDTFQPLVSLGVGLILFEAGLRLRLQELRGGARPVVLRLITVGTLVTGAGVTLAVKLIFGLDWGVSVMLGAILVVSGPTVVLPLLAFVRPTDRVRSVLKWEGVLIDPIGALLGVFAFHAVQAGAGGNEALEAGELVLSVVAGLVVGSSLAGVLWLLLRTTQRRAPRQGVPAALMVVAGALAAADILREDSGFVATTAMGMILANQRELDVSRILEFQGTVVTLLIGMLFILISASVEPSQVSALLPEGLVLIAVLVLVVRPLVVALGTWGSELGREERIFTAWLAPRGIVAAATASAFGLQLTEAGVDGAGDILPIAFIAIFGTVVLYGLSAARTPAGHRRGRGHHRARRRRSCVGSADRRGAQGGRPGGPRVDRTDHGAGRGARAGARGGQRPDRRRRGEPRGGARGGQRRPAADRQRRLQRPRGLRAAPGARARARVQAALRKRSARRRAIPRRGRRPVRRGADLR
jgi:NhaP-type Na+/H+ or K+/H+ antiporter